MPRTVTFTDSAAIAAPARPPRMRIGRQFLNGLTRKVEYGQLLIQLPSGEAIHCAGPHPGPVGTIVLHRWRALRRMVVGGDIGFAEAYMSGDWSTPDLTGLIEVAARNHRTVIPALDGTWPVRLFNRAAHLLRGNTKRGSRRNIPAHYDLGNAFYAEWLDGGMTYSSGLYAGDDTSLERAQAAKQELAIGALALSGGERVLEIGCGWGGLAERLAREQGCHVTGLSLSPSQLSYARERLAGMDLRPGRVAYIQRDYRDMDGTFDRIVSIEMLEAVGKEYWDTYFATIRDRLRPGGIAVLQVITMADERYASYERGTDFIQRYIFPGGMLPSPSVMREKIAAVGLNLDGVRTFGESYARTLADWRARFLNAWPRLSRMGFDARFQRKWEYYLSYCEAGFRAGAIDVGLYRLHRPIHCPDGAVP